MSIELSVIVKGAEYIQARFEGIARKLPMTLDDGIDELGELGREHAYNWCPVLTGYLQSTIEHTHTFLRSIVRAATRYVRFVEFGTRYMAARPFMRPAKMAILDVLQQTMKTKTREGIR